MRKFIMFLFCLLSLGTMVLITISISELFNLFGLGTFEIEAIISLVQEMPIEEIIPALTVVLRGIFELYGIPLVVFLVNLNGLSSK